MHLRRLAGRTNATHPPNVGAPHFKHPWSTPALSSCSSGPAPPAARPRLAPQCFERCGRGMGIGPVFERRDVRCGAPGEPARRRGGGNTTRAAGHARAASGACRPCELDCVHHVVQKAKSQACVPCRAAGASAHDAPSPGAACWQEEPQYGDEKDVQPKPIVVFLVASMWLLVKSELLTNCRAAFCGAV